MSHYYDIFKPLHDQTLNSIGHAWKNYITNYEDEQREWSGYMYKEIYDMCRSFYFMTKDLEVCAFYRSKGHDIKPDVARTRAAVHKLCESLSDFHKALNAIEDE